MKNHDPLMDGINRPQLLTDIVPMLDHEVAYWVLDTEVSVVRVDRWDFEHIRHRVVRGEYAELNPRYKTAEGILTYCPERHVIDTSDFPLVPVQSGNCYGCCNVEV